MQTGWPKIEGGYYKKRAWWRCLVIVRGPIVTKTTNPVNLLSDLLRAFNVEVALTNLQQN